jgi:hypothetical protein
VRIRPFLFWPMLSPLDTVPSPGVQVRAWRQAICAGAGADADPERHSLWCAF